MVEHSTRHKTIGVVALHLQLTPRLLAMDPPPPPTDEVELAPSLAPKKQKKANPLNIEEVLARKRAADEAAAKVCTVLDH